MKIVVYGPGCARCHQTMQIIRDVLSELGVAAEVDKVSDYLAMAAAGVSATPAVAVDGVLKAFGRIPRPEEVKKWLTT